MAAAHREPLLIVGSELFMFGQLDCVHTFRDFQLPGPFEEGCWSSDAFLQLHIFYSNSRHDVPSALPARGKGHLKNLFIYLFGYAGSSLWHVRSSSLTRGQTQAPLHWERGVLADGTSGKVPKLALFFKRVL